MKTGQQWMRIIVSLLHEKGLRDADFARAMEVAPSYVGNWKARGIPADRLPKAADVLGVSVDYLTGRIAAPISNDAPRVSLNGKIPVIGYAKLGDDGFFTDIQTDQPQETSGYLTLPSDDPSAYALKCEGTSMMPRIQPGEYVIAEPTRAPEPGDEVVVYDTSGRVMVKRFLYWRDGNLFLQSVNSDANNIILSKNEVKDINPILAIVPKRFLKTFID